jgi:uncharacterized membrane-anchored protein YitT (DUF2179 family)
MVKKMLSNTIEACAPIARIVMIRQVKDAMFICLGVLMAAVGLKGFLLPNKFLDGGAMGVSLLLEYFTKLDLSVLIVLVNLPFVLLGARQISTNFALKSAIAIIGLSIMVHFIELPVVTDDKLLIAIFGGFFLGAGIGFAIRGGSVIDGTEVLAINISKQSSLTVGDFIAVFNIILFSVAAIVIGVETAMYSMLTYLSASKTVDFIINGVEEYLGVLIVSRKADDVKTQIIRHVGRGVTAFKTAGGYGSSGLYKEEGKVLFCVVTRLEVTKLLLEIRKVDPDAFVVQHAIRDTRGGMIKKRPLH